MKEQNKHQHHRQHKKAAHPEWTPVPNNKSYDFPNVNRVVIAGQLAQDPPLRWTARGVPVTNFVIATDPEPEDRMIEGMNREHCYVSVVVWAQQAVQCNKYLKKGNSVLIIGELQSMPNSAPDKGYYPIQVNAQWIQYLEKGIVSFIDPSYENQGEGMLEMSESYSAAAE
jgi:single stranded DNA-binding protein